MIKVFGGIDDVGKEYCVNVLHLFVMRLPPAKIGSWTTSRVVHEHLLIITTFESFKVVLVNWSYLCVATHGVLLGVQCAYGV